MSEDAPTEDPSPLPAIWRAARWILAFVLLAVFGYAVFSHAYLECSTARTATTLRATCAPPTAMSATVAVLLLLVVVLLLPDLIRPRGGDVRGRIERVEQSSRATQRDVDELSGALLAVRLQSAVAESPEAPRPAEEAAPWTQEQSARLEDEWRRRGADDAAVQGLRAADRSSEDERRFRTVGELALGWERLSELLRLTPRLSVAVDLADGPEAARRQWVRQSLVTDLQEPLVTLRNLRAAAVASRATPQDDIDRGVQLLRDLTDTVEEALDRRR